MSDKPVNKIPLAQDVKQPLQRQPDGEGFYVHYSGGLNAIQKDHGSWFVEPVFDSGPCAKGLMSGPLMAAFLHQRGLKPIAFHRMGWHNGLYHSTWSPIVPGRPNHMSGPADVWGRISANLSRLRTKEDLRNRPTLGREEISQLMDARGEVERLAHSISFSLKNMDINVEQIAEFYHEQLVNLMAENLLDERRLTTTLDQTLYAHVNAFFMHLGAARDYLAALVVFRLGKDHRRHDSMARLVEIVRTGDLVKDAILAALTSKGYVCRREASVDKIELSGWLAVVTKLRNVLMHQRPYGYWFSEKMGFARALDEVDGIYRYFRLIVVDGIEYDVLDLIHDHYINVCSMFLSCADASGYDANIMVISDTDIISVVNS